MTDYVRMNEIYTDAFGAHRPARSAIGVAELPLGALSRWRRGPAAWLDDDVIRHCASASSLMGVGAAPPQSVLACSAP